MPPAMPRLMSQPIAYTSEMTRNTRQAVSPKRRRTKSPLVKPCGISCLMRRASGANNISPIEPSE